MKITVLILRSLLGLMYLVFGLNFFFHFIPMEQPALPEKAMNFSKGLMESGYFFQYMKVVEILCGLFLLLNRYTALFLAILFPVSLNIFLYHAILAPSGLVMGLGILVIHLFLAFAYRKYYTGMFTAAPVAD